MRRTAKDFGLVVLAAAATLLLLAGYELWQKRAQAPVAPAAAGQSGIRPSEKSATAASPGQPDGLSAAHAALGPEAEVLAEGIFPAAGGRQVLAVQRLPRVPGAPAPGVPSSQQSGETAVEVIRVSILVLEDSTWKEAFRADEHLKNRRGYLPGAPAEAVPGWWLEYSQTPDSGFLLAFTPVGLPAGRKQSTVHAAWNGKRGEYDAVKASGNGYLEPSATPGGSPILIRP